MVSRSALEVAITAKGKDLIRMDNDVAHRLYRPQSAFTVCGVRAHGLEQVPEGPLLLRPTLRMCRRCWAGADFALCERYEEIKNDE